MDASQPKQTLYPNLKRGSGAQTKNRPPTSPPRLNPSKPPPARRGHRFPPGNNANPNGRPKGVPNHATREVKELARTLVERPAGLRALARQYDEGQLPPPVLCMLWHYAYGKPKERIEVQGQVDVLRFVISNQPEPLTLEADASSTLSPAEAEAESERVKKPNDLG